MKAENAVLFMLIMAPIFPALSSVCQNEIGQSVLPDDSNSRLSIMSVDTKRLEERMNGALADMISQSVGKTGYSGSIASSPKRSNPLDEGLVTSDYADPVSSAINSSLANRSTNSSFANLSAINSSLANRSISPLPVAVSAAEDPASNSSGPKSPIPAQGDSAGEQGLGAATNSKFNGYYGISSSQHQMGKNNIDSSTLLSGSFSLEKSVKFQDRGI